MQDGGGNDVADEDYTPSVLPTSPIGWFLLFLPGKEKFKIISLSIVDHPPVTPTEPLSPSSYSLVEQSMPLQVCFGLYNNIVFAYGQ